MENKSENVDNSTTAQTDANTVLGAVKCAEGWHDGSCCCNCRNQIELYKHPWNKVNKGSIMESTEMYACIVQFDCDKEYKGIIFEKKHGMCELHVRR
jgi:hypothetical protein